MDLPASVPSLDQTVVPESCATETRAAEMGAPLSVRRPARQEAPIIVASPHSGRAYHPDFLAAARLDPMALRKSEDVLVDELFGAAPSLGLPLLAADFPRAWCDVNREAWELDPSMFEERLPDFVNARSPRVAAGLGTIARVVASGEPIYRRKLRFAEAEARIRDCWQPYHAALSALIAETRARFGACLLVDCHSMPSAPPGGAQRGPDIVIGDAHGASCARPLSALIETALRGEGFIVRRNDPYAGGYVTRHYGRPREAVHAVQVEIARPLYVDEKRLRPHDGFASVKAAMTRLLETLIAVIPERL